MLPRGDARLSQVAEAALALLAIEPGPIRDVAAWEASSVAYALPLLGGARARALDFVFSLGEDTLGAPVLRLLPAEPDAEKRTLRVLVTQDTPGAVAGSLVTTSSATSGSASSSPRRRPAAARPTAAAAAACPRTGWRRSRARWTPRSSRCARR